MTLAYDPGADEWNNKYTSESATIYTLYTDIEPPNPLQVPQGQVMFLDNSNIPIGEVANAVKVFVSFITNQESIYMELAIWKALPRIKQIQYSSQILSG